MMSRHNDGLRGSYVHIMFIQMLNMVFELKLIKPSGVGSSLVHKSEAVLARSLNVQGHYKIYSHKLLQLHFNGRFEEC